MTQIMTRYINKDMHNFVMLARLSALGVTMWCCLERTGGNNNQKSCGSGPSCLKASKR